MTHDQLQNEFLEKIALDFENKAIEEITSDLHSYNDCAIISKMWFHAAAALRGYKSK